jgi:hypothetical protein
MLATTYRDLAEELNFIFLNQKDNNLKFKLSLQQVFRQLRVISFGSLYPLLPDS